MLNVITDKNQIKQYSDTFNSYLNKIFSSKVKCHIGYHGGSWESVIFYSEKIKMWTLNWTNKNHKCVNLFGLDIPIEGKKVSITGQINFPLKGIDRKIAGAFAIDDNKRIFILHRGKIAGGKPGVGKTLLMNNYKGRIVTANDGEQTNKFCLVGELGSPQLPKQLSLFVNELARVRALAGTDHKNIILPDNFSYTDESTGTTVTENSEPKTINRVHGYIVNALSAKLKDSNFNVGNDKNRDLFIYTNNKISTLFEIKSSASTQDLFSAVGQLLVYSIPLGGRVNLFAVLPTKLNKQVEKRLHELKISILYYKWNRKNIEFIGIDQLIKNKFKIN